MLRAAQLDSARGIRNSDSDEEVFAVLTLETFYSNCQDLLSSPVGPKHEKLGISPDIVLKLFAKILKVLNYIHEEGIVVCDLRPKNIAIILNDCLNDFSAEICYF